MGKGTRYTEAQIIATLKEIDAGKPVAQVARDKGISEQTIYKWRNRYGGMSQSELKELKALTEENRRLKSIVANQALDIEAYKELQKLKY
jgi:putative transposase